MAHMCVACTNNDETVEFPTLKDYIDHEKGGHVSRPKKELPPSPPVTPSRTEVAAPVVKRNQAAVSLPTPTEQRDPVYSTLEQPLSLQYKWVGIHTTCGNEVKTIEIDVDEKVMVVAYCAHCDTKLEQKTVLPIPLQTSGKYVIERQDDTFERHMRTDSSET